MLTTNPYSNNIIGVESIRNMIDTAIQPNADVVFSVGDNQKEMVRLCENGDVYIKGRLVKHDLDLVRGMRSFLAATGHLKRDIRYHTRQALDQEEIDKEEAL